VLSAGELNVDYIRSLRDRAQRDASGRFFIEGVRFVVTAADQRHDLEALVVAPSLLRSAVAEMLVRRRRRDGTPVLELADDEFRSLSLLGEPQGVGAVVRQRWCGRDALADPRRDALWLALATVRSPGNFGSLVRTAEAVGASGVLCLSGDVDPYDPHAVRATMGSIFHLRFCRLAPAELRAANRYGELFIVGASPDADRDFRVVSYRRPVILMIGGERRGLSDDQRELCDALVRIPMRGRCDSLNLAVAASVLLYEVHGQRHPARRREAGFTAGTRPCRRSGRGRRGGR
jgi:TrmH family RNA methyltransferase